MRSLFRVTVLGLSILAYLAIPISGSEVNATGGAVSFFPTDSNTLAIFEFNGNVSDSSGNGRHAELLNPDSAYVSSTYGQGLVLPNQEDEFQGIQWNSYKSLLVPPYTVETLIYPEELDSWNRLFTHDSEDDNGLYYDDGSLVNYPDDALDGVSLPAQTRHCLAWSAPASPANKLNLYLDGEFLGQVNRTYNEPNVAWFFMDDTEDVPNENINGYVDAMRISNVVRTDDELADTCAASNEGVSLAEMTDDQDGISKEIEDSAPNDGDANNDGYVDSDQPNVSSFVNSKTGDYVSVEVSDECSLSSVSSRGEDANAIMDSAYSYDHGFVNFTANCGDPGYETTVRLHIYGASADNYILRKHNPNTSAYFTIAGSNLSGDVIDGKSLVIAEYRISDGGELDIDNTENGTIVDPVGLANRVLSSPDTGFRRN